MLAIRRNLVLNVHLVDAYLLAGLVVDVRTGEIVSMVSLPIAGRLTDRFGVMRVAPIGVALTLVVSTLTTYSGVKAVDGDLERLMYSLGASRAQVFRKVVVHAGLLTAPVRK